MNLLYISLIVLVSLVIFWTFCKKVISTFKKFFLFYNYKKTIDLFEFFLERSYHMTYENSIVTWIANGIQTIPADEKETMERDFVKQTFLIMGDNNKELISNFFGGDSFVINYMIMFIRKKIADDGLADAIKKASTESEPK